MDSHEVKARQDRAEIIRLLGALVDLLEKSGDQDGEQPESLKVKADGKAMLRRPDC